MRLVPVAISILLSFSGYFNANATDHEVKDSKLFDLSDSSVLVREVNGSKLYLSTAVRDRSFWTRVLSQDTLITSYFAQKIKEPAMIFVSDIVVSGDGYVFRLLARPEFKPEEAATQLPLFAYAYYRVRTMFDTRPIRTKIVGFEYVYTVIEL